MSEIDGAIAARRRAKSLLDEARRREAETGLPDGKAYKAAANAYQAAMLMEMNSALLSSRRNSSGDKLRFLCDIVRRDEDRSSLTVEVLASIVKTQYEAEAKEFWPSKTGDDLSNAVITFARQKGRWKRIIGCL